MKQLFKENQYLKVKIEKLLIGILLLFIIVISIHQEVQLRSYKELLIRQQTSSKHLENRVEDLENQNSDLEDRINDLESRVDDLESNGNN